MNTQQIKAFMTISECESFTEAAKLLYTTQSTLSKTIKSLENELDVVLFSRKGNKVSLTQAGVVAKEYFAFILENFAGLEHALQSYTTHNESSLTLAITTSAAYCNLLEPVVLYQNENPDIEIRIHECVSSEFYRLFDSNIIDAAIGWMENPCQKGFERRILAETEWHLLVSRDNPLAEYDLINLNQARNESFILQNSDLNINKFATLCNQNGFKPRITCKGQTNAVLANMVANNLGVAFLIPGMVQQEQNCKFVRFNGAPKNYLGVEYRDNDYRKELAHFIEYYIMRYRFPF